MFSLGRVDLSLEGKFQGEWIKEKITAKEGETRLEDKEDHAYLQKPEKTAEEKEWRNCGIICTWSLVLGMGLVFYG